MITDPTLVLNHQARLHEAVASYLQAVDAGTAPDQSDWLERYAEVADDLRAFFGDQERLHHLAEPLRGLDSSGSPPARSFGDYDLLEEIARGGMGVVYKARQKSLNRVVALKMLFPGSHSRDDIERFLRTEAEVAAGLEHPHIVPIYEFGRGHAAEGHPSVPFLSMKLIEGGSLKEAVACGRWAVDSKDQQRRPAQLLSTVARAVHHAHQRGILHRDLKPGNILLDSQGQPFVTDFGLAQRVEGDGPQGQSGVIVGTALYMAPEQAAGQKRLTTAADVYSLGAILYELVAGRPPFQGESIVDTLQQVKERAPARPRALNPHLDRDLETICLKCLDKEPQRRYGSAEALADDLDRWQANEPIRARPAGQVERLWRWGRRNPLVASLSAAIVLVAALGFVGVFGQMQVAITHENEAKENARQAQKNEQDANKERDEARALAEKLQAALEQNRRTTYAAHMNLAKHAWEEAAVPRVQELLDQQRPKPGEPDLRGFEWYYLNRLCHADAPLTLKGGNDFPAHSLAFSPDGKRLVSTTDWGTSGSPTTGRKVYEPKLKVWDAQTGQELLSRSLQDGDSSVVISPDGRRLAWGSGDRRNPGNPGEVKLWDAQTGQELRALPGHTRYVGSVAFSPDGKRLASASGVPFGSSAEPKPGEVKVWDAQTGQELLSLKGGSGDVHSVAFSPDGKRLAHGIGGGLQDGKRVPGAVKVWDAQTGQELLTLQGGGGSVAFGPDGKRLASRSGGGRVGNTRVPEEVKVWDAQTGQELPNLNEQSDGAILFAFSPDGKRLATAGQRSRMPRIKVCDTETGREIFTFQRHSSGVSSLAFSPDSKRLASSSEDRTLRLWDLQTGQELQTLKGHTDGVASVAFSPDGKRLASSSYDAVKVWDVQKHPETLTLKGNRTAFSPDFRRLASAATDNTVKVWDAHTGQETLTLKGHTNNIWSLAFSPDGKRLASGEGSLGNNNQGPRVVKVWDAQTGLELLSLSFQGQNTRMAFSPDGKRLAIRSGPELKVWDAQTGQELLSLKGSLGGPFSSIVFSPDGKRLASSSARELKVWDAQTGQELLDLKGGGPSVAFSPDGKRLASAAAASGGTVRVWNVQTGQKLLAFKGGHTGYVRSVAFHPDGRRLASADTDGTVKVWDAHSGQETLTLKGHAGGVESVAFSPDGHRMASASLDGTVMIRDATPLPEKR